MYKNIFRLSFFFVLYLSLSMDTTAQSRINTDSLKQAIQQKRDSMIAANKRRVDSIKAETTRRVDSMKAAQAIIMDSIRRERDRRLDSLAALKKYRNSRHYKDSVAQVRQAFKDSIAERRLATLDSIKLERLKFTDSLKQAREHTRDSIQTMIAERRDSLLKAREERIAAREKGKNGEKPMTEEERKKAAIDEKHEKRKEEYDNTKFLKKRWRFPRSALQNTYTRYNYYYNADLMYHEMLDRVYRLQETNFDSIISVYRVSPESASKYGGSAQDDIIKKASLDIQMHDPRSKWQDDLYFLIARSYFYKNDLDNSIPFTKYIITHFRETGDKKKKKGKRRKRPDQLIEKVKTSDGKSKRVLSICSKEPSGFLSWVRHRPIYNDALMLLTRSYATEGYHTEALSLLHQMMGDINFPERLRGQSDRLLTQIYLQQDDYQQASEHLQNAMESTRKKKEKTRLYFLQGQIYQEYDKDDSAYYAFDRISKSSPDVDIEIQSYLKKTELLYKNGWTQYASGIDRDMNRMLRQEKYRDYYGLLHFNKGLIAIVNQDQETAEEQFTLSIESNADTSSQYKALDQLVNFYFNSDNFVKANQYYTMLRDLNSSGNFKSRADYNDYTYILPTLAENQSVWIHVDSLMYLSTLSDKEQTKWAKAENEKDANKDQGFQKLKPQGTTSSAAATKFYFSNSGLVESGKTKFKQKWGAMPNEDNWGVSTLMKFNPSTRETEEVAEVDTSTAVGYQKYLAMIPHSPEQVSRLNFRKQEAIYNLGNISYRQLNDPERANKYFDTLLVIYPMSEFRPKVLFGQYLIAEKLGDQQSAQAYKSVLQAQYPGSYSFMFEEYVEGSQNKKKETAEQKYAELYYKFSSQDYAGTKLLYQQDLQFFEGLPEYEQKSKLLYIQAEMAATEYEQAMMDVDALIGIQPQSDVLAFAQELKRALSNKMGVKADLPEPIDTALQSQYQFDINRKAQMIMELDSTDVISEIKIKLVEFNKSFFANDKLNVSEKILPNKKRVISIYNFENYPQAMIYRNKLLEQWSKSMQIPPKSRDHFLFINGRNLSYLYGQDTYENYKKYFKQNFPD